MAAHLFSHLPRLVSILPGYLRVLVMTILTIWPRIIVVALVLGLVWLFVAGVKRLFRRVEY
jgi:hypothetical protein